jgi:CubicO group peptidase (beta-lactamase class C family)
MPTLVGALRCAAFLVLLVGPGGRTPLSVQRVAGPVAGLVAGPDSLAAALVEAAAAWYMAAPGRVGLSVGVLRGVRMWTAHYGEVAKGTGQRPTNRAVYEIGSVTKTVTGQLLARAVRNRRLRLDDGVRTDLGGVANLAYAGEPVRLVHLVNHTSGLPVHSVEFPTGAPPDTIVAREAGNTDAALLARLGAVTLTPGRPLYDQQLPADAVRSRLAALGPSAADRAPRVAACEAG